MSSRDPGGASERGLLARLGLHRPELRAWALYDWANSAFVLTIQAAIFPIYFTDVAAGPLADAEATRRFAWTTSIALGAVAVMAPVLGALADYAGVKKRSLAAFLVLGVGSTAALWFVQRGDWLLGASLFALANVGAQGSFVFYDSLLPHIASPEEMDRVSTAGFATGYFGSSILFVAQIAWIQWPEAFGLPAPVGADATLPARIAFVSVAVWWALFSVPLFLRVDEPARHLEPDERPGQRALRVALQRLRETFGELRRYRHALLMLVAFLVYNDGIGTIIRMASIYGAEIGLDRTAMLLAILLVQLIGVPFAFLFGAIAGRVGTKPAILSGLGVYVGIVSFAYFMQTALHFFLLAILVGMVQGGCQALSRSLFASLIPSHKSSEFFGFYAVLEKFAGIAGPAAFALTSQLTGSSRQAILTVLFFFVAGGLLLWKVDVEEGRRVAREAERGLRPASR
ncbi:MAG: MFS transporter [Gemmatimonadota bacterium]|nr:MFS transporter [Gemmatimonadota bacterium]